MKIKKKEIMNWFKSEFSPQLSSYTVNYEQLPRGQFGRIDRITFSNKKRGGKVHFCSSGAVDVYFYDHVKQEHIVSIVAMPDEQERAQWAFETLRKYL